MCDEQSLTAHHKFTVRTPYGKFSGDSADMVAQYVYYFGVWEPVVSKLIRERLGPGDTFVDVGANVGWYVLLAAQKLGPTGRVVALEPSPANISALKNNLAKNRLGNVRLVQEAAWSVESELSLFQGPSSNSGASTVVPTFAGQKDCDEAGAVRARPLAAILSPEEISSLRVLKIDVEGAELEVIRGFEPALDSVPENLEVFLELNPTEYNVEELLAPFRKRGFRVWVLPNDYRQNFYFEYSEADFSGQFKELLGTPTEQMDVLITRAQP